MKRIKWKPVLMTREDGTNYVMGDDIFNQTPFDSAHLLQQILQMPEGKPIGFSEAYQLISEFTDDLAEEQGGRAAAAWMNRHGFFPGGLTALGYRIEIRTTDFDLVG